jgi:hypothetical protein
MWIVFFVYIRSHSSINYIGAYAILSTYCLKLANNITSLSECNVKNIPTDLNEILNTLI